jgi:hypothetical protein
LLRDGRVREQARYVQQRLVSRCCVESASRLRARRTIV